MSWSLVLHGGAGSIERHRLTPEQDSGARAGLSRALDAGAAILSGGGSALDAVEAAVQVLEDDPHFNAGRGAAFTRDGGIELDAAIMDGATRAAGAVAGITQTRSPVALARRVMAASPHVLLSGVGAEQFARDQDLAVAPEGWFETPERRRQLDEMLSRNADAFDIDMKYGTVGAVARDSTDHVAAATSTGGVTGKRWGRIGDSPLIGAGTFADDRACAVSCTGSGEFFIRVGVGHEIAARIRLAGDTPQAAADAVMAEVSALGGTGGVIVATPAGDAVWSLTTPGMYRARATAAGLREVAIYGDE
ncbi:isoaspartyl peptidase/L-asparaginase [Arthrobacter sp. TPD3018]|uniref:isoaspartyl peptidase/L-asparaginase family protein n=1 Tax=Bacteria TaxID=2 RepID=UPI000D51B4E3|nr:MULTISPECIES: isoaspartyl peptidase/L-asparaginase [Bacteria]PVE58866.1 isoaspartyl peptidase/L-asparaginase [Sphingomonas sp. TPD3009]PVE60387.1 isoaspartyl peptidase/L-asparaginase [Arthrobacter sp. TPD3018]PVE87065.1 isoaspartyl peptidase/L-asparaginase [Sphingomonas melonis]